MAVLRATAAGLAELAGTTTTRVGFACANHPAAKPTTAAATIHPTNSGFRIAVSLPTQPTINLTGAPAERAGDFRHDIYTRHLVARIC